MTIGVYSSASNELGTRPKQGVSDLLALEQFSNILKLDDDK